ncbi:MAG TPA: hypothetical protein VFC44_03325 [Candidatus Saccharimonadales bacterium]|nr:hypothetical protein [Candidatus Saccharimonadales bacterium]
MHSKIAEQIVPPNAIGLWWFGQSGFVINSAFCNLGPAEAALLAQELDVKVVIPCHHDLFMDNCQPPQMLRTNLKILGLGDRYRLLTHGVCYLYPES